MKKKNKRYSVNSYITTDFASSTKTITAQGISEEIEVVNSGYKLKIVVSKLEKWHRESIEELDREQASRRFQVANTEAYMKLTDDFVVTSLFHKNGKDYSFSIQFARTEGFAAYEDIYMKFLDSVVIN